MRFRFSPTLRCGFTAIESLLMIGLMTIMALVTWAIVLKETDPNRKGPGAWEQMDSAFVPAFRETDDAVEVVPDPPLSPKFGQPD